MDIYQKIINKPVFHINEIEQYSLTANLINYLREDNQPTILINSIGGNCELANAIVSIIQSYKKTKIIGIGIGTVQSAALPILTACNIRYAFKSCFFLIHPVESRNTNIFNYFRNKRSLDFYNETIYFPWLNKYNLKHLKNKHYEFYAPKALKLKLIDKII